MTTMDFNPLSYILQRSEPEKEVKELII